MAKTATIFAPSRDPLSLALLVLPQASILEVASALDPLRAANRLLGWQAFRWRIVTPTGGPVALTCGIELPSSGPLASAEGAEVLVAVVGFRQTIVATPSLVRELARIAPRFAAVGGIDAGAWVMARAGLLNGYRATVHWEDLEDLAATYPEVEVVPDRWVIDRNRFTAGGATPAADLMLHLIGTRLGPALARQVAAAFLTTPRPGSDPQIAPPDEPAPDPALDPTLDPRVAQALARMEARIDAPEPATATARAVGLSPRRLEMLFRAAFGTTPAAHALSLRLAAARRMVTDTSHPLAEVALRTGFSSASALSRAFRREFGQAPSALRIRVASMPAIGFSNAMPV